ncbi:MAG TPA: TonB-dependent receptor [Cyclobacteriaceae bacterium]|nr:TonB-dependent receptor [Cyclobacteriaceae bacterium]
MNKIILLFLLTVSVQVFGQAGNSLTGTVTDKNSKALAGASIHILNTNSGAISDKDGKFEITNLEKGKYALEVTAVGFASTQLETVVNEGSNTLAITLAESLTQLDAVVVTAQKQEEDAQRIASSVSVLSSKQIQQYRMWNTSDLSAVVPNLYSANPGDNRNVTSIRGITSSSYDPAVATYVDGVNQFGLDTYIAQLFDVERIEVLRGPQGTLYGRNAMGGVINIITKQPTNTTNGFVEANIGNYGQQRYGFGIRTPLIPNKLYFGASGVYDQTNGFYTNQFNNSHFDKKHSITGNYYLKYIASPRWAITLNAKHNENRNNGTFPLTGSVEDAFANPFKVNQNATAKMIDNVLNGSLTVAHSGHGLNFTSQTTYQSNYRYYDKPMDADFSPIDGITVINNYGKKWNTVKVATQEFKFTSPANTSSPLKWTVGTYMYYQKSPVKQAIRYGMDAKPIAGDSLFTTINTTKSTNAGIAFFGQTSYTFFEKLEVILGMRYDYEHKKSSVIGEYQHDPDPNPIAAYTQSDAGTGSYGALSPKGTVAYHLTDYSQVFGTYSRGFRTGGLTQLKLGEPLRTYKPEYSNNFEVGFKNVFFDNHLKANASVFYIDVTDAQVPTLVLPDAITAIKNTGSLTSKGFDFELAATPVKGLQIDYTYGLTKATYNSLRYAQYGQELDLKGKHQIYTPASTSMLALQYQIGVGPSRNFRILARGEWMYFGKQYFDLSNTIVQSAYSLLNTRFGIAYKNVEVMFWGRNLAGKKYIAYAYDYGPTHLGNPKTYGVTVRVSF